MRNKILYFTGLAILTAVYAAQPASAPAPNVLTLPTYGFRINSFESPTSGGAGALVMSWPSLPLSGGRSYAPNVNVIFIPTSDDNINNYVATERLDMQTKGFTIVKNGDNASSTEWKVEYIALAQVAPGVPMVPMHWYAHAVWTKNRIYIASGGVPDEMWAQVSDKIKECADSLQATGTAVDTPVPVLSLTSSSVAAPAPTASTAK